ncbi:Caveolin-2, variant 3 [Cymbomonas tetramitiformis]|uniref:Caveolin-2, variant 3 n=1 Tax=Cymbomonas tetramitiformis TaxID=36881 RepID=A0AAE0FU54_9CHLO|nr:Caveolin-2, variant 3 [Cymbomonas tetramitiformis]
MSSHPESSEWDLRPVKQEAQLAEDSAYASGKVKSASHSKGESNSTIGTELLGLIEENHAEQPLASDHSQLSLENKTVHPVQQYSEMRIAPLPIFPSETLGLPQLPQNHAPVQQPSTNVLPPLRGDARASGDASLAGSIDNEEPGSADGGASDEQHETQTTATLSRRTQSVIERDKATVLARVQEDTLDTFKKLPSVAANATQETGAGIPGPKRATTVTGGTGETGHAESQIRSMPTMKRNYEVTKGIRETSEVLSNCVHTAMQIETEEAGKHRSWGLFSFSNPIRKLCIALNNWKYFHAIIMGCVGFSTLTLVFATPIDMKIFWWVFFFEFLVKTIATGVWFGRSAYFKSKWNQLDFFVLVGSGVDTLINDASEGLVAMVVLRILRLLRPLRTFGKIESLRIVLSVIFKASGQLGRVLLMLLLLILLYSSVGVVLYAGVLRERCMDRSQLPSDYTGFDTRNDMLDTLGDTWKLWSTQEEKEGTCKSCSSGYVCTNLNNPYYDFLSFDNFFSSMLVVFIVITGESWVSIMYRVCNTTSWASLVFFVTLVLFGTHLFVNMLLAVIREVFSSTLSFQLKQKVESRKSQMQKGMQVSFWGEEGTTSEQGSLFNTAAKQYRLVRRNLLLKLNVLRELPSYVVIHGFLLKIALSDHYERFNMAATFTNTIVLSVTHHNMSATLSDNLMIVNGVLTIIFLTESGIKIAAYGYEFLNRDFDMFDLFVNIVSTVSNYASGGTLFSAGKSKSISALRSLKQVRVIRIFRVAKYSDALRAAVKVLSESAYLLSSLLLMQFMIMCFYALIGLQMFQDGYKTYDDRVRDGRMFNYDLWRPVVTGCGQFGSTAETCHLVLQKMGIDDTESSVAACGLQEITANCSDTCRVRAYNDNMLEFRLPNCMDTIWEELEAQKGQSEGSLNWFKQEERHYQLSDRGGFRDFWWAIVTLFQALTLEGWTALMFDAMYLNYFIGLAFYVSWVAFGTYFLLSLMVSVILDNFEREYGEEMRRCHEERVLAKRLKAASTENEGGLEYLPEVTTPDGEVHPRSIQFHNIDKIFQACSSRPLSEATRTELFMHIGKPAPEDWVDFDLVCEVLPDLDIITPLQAVKLRGLYALWVSHDVDNSGTLGVAEVLSLVKSLGLNAPKVGAPGADHSQRVLVDLSFMLKEEAEHDNVDFYEFVSMFLMIEEKPERGVLSGALKLEHLGFLRHKFMEYDEDESGYISSDELGDFLDSMGIFMNDFELRLLMLEMDSNDDDQVTFQEFLRSLVKYFTDSHKSALSPGKRDTGAKVEDISDPQWEGGTGRSKLDALSQGGEMGRKWALAFAVHARSLPPEHIPNLKENLTDMNGIESIDEKDEETELASSMEEAEELGKSFGIFSMNCDLRKRAKKVIEHPYFDNVVVCLICGSCLLVAHEDPIRDDPEWYEWGELFFTFIFTVELLLKMFVLGVYFGPRAYLKDAWNILDFVTVVSSLMSLIVINLIGVQIPGLNRVTMMRSLRPLKALARRRRARNSLNALAQAIPSFVSVTLMAAFICLLFGIVATERYAGGFYHCVTGGFYVQPKYVNITHFTDIFANESNYTSLSTDEDRQKAIVNQIVQVECEREEGNRFSVPNICFNASDWKASKTDTHDYFILKQNLDTSSMSECMVEPDNRWVNSILNFDNLWEAFYCLFVVITGEGWVELMYQSVDIGSREIGNGSLDADYTRNVTIQQDHEPLDALFYICFIIVFSFFLLDLYAGAVYSYYVKVKLEDEGNSILTNAQRQWQETNAILINTVKSMPKPTGKEAKGFRKISRWFIQSWIFHVVCLLNVLMSFFLVLVQQADQAESTTKITLRMTWGILCISLFEYTVKLHFNGLSVFLKDKWNRFDLCVYLVAVFMSVMRLVPGQPVPTYIGLFTMRMMRFGHLVSNVESVKPTNDHALKVQIYLKRYLHGISRVNIVFETFISLLYTLVDLALIMFVFYFIFGVIGMNLFGHLPLDGDEYNRNANFRDIYISIMTLFRVSTGEDWQAIFTDLVWFGCHEETRIEHPEDCPKVVTFFYFMVFYMIMVIMVTSLLVAVIIDIFTEVMEREYNSLGMSHIIGFMNEWNERCRFDAADESFLYVSDLKDLLANLPQPLGVRTVTGSMDPDGDEVMQRIYDLELEVDDMGRLYLMGAVGSARM